MIVSDNCKLYLYYKCVKPYLILSLRISKSSIRIKVMPYFVVSLTDDAYSIIYDHKMFMIQATDVKFEEKCLKCWHLVFVEVLCPE
jgi:hypothetical protein